MTLAALAPVRPVRPAAPRTKRALVADLFCGAGSLSMGAHDALTELGYRPEFVAVNHWPVATQTYAANHPGARVHCVTLESALPSHLVPEGRLDLLMAGIECTFFSRARGGKPMTDQQRMSAWHVVRWCTELRTSRLLMENVPEFRDWGPVSPTTRRPLKSRKGEYFRAWVASLQNIGFRFEARVLNCADFGDATTRERLFMMAWQPGKPLPWPEPSHGRSGDLFSTEPWRSARDIIDWSIPGRSIFSRKRPLAPKTIARIAAGVVKFRWPEPFLVVLRRNCDARGLDLPLPVITAGGTHLGLAQPFVATVAHGNSRHERDPDSRRCRSPDDPLQTIHAGGNKLALVAPYYGQGSGETCQSVDMPLPTATTKARFGLAVAVTHSDPSNRARDLDQPLPTLTTAKRGELAFITAQFGERHGQKPRVHSVDAPTPTICATGHTNLVTAGDQYDILFRMLQPHELAAATSIPEYRFTGTKEQVVRQIGQAVPRRTARALALALMRDTP
jgi:DNA (cytosine-5)-methyltransferase 1